MRVKVIRGFRFGDKVYMPDQNSDPEKRKDVIVNLEASQARSVIASNKAEAIDEEEAATGPMTTKGKKGEANA
jgi:hypothetical protein